MTSCWCLPSKSVRQRSAEGLCKRPQYPSSLYQQEEKSTHGEERKEEKSREAYVVSSNLGISDRDPVFGLQRVESHLLGKIAKELAPILAVQPIALFPARGR